MRKEPVYSTGASHPSVGSIAHVAGVLPPLPPSHHHGKGAAPLSTAAPGDLGEIRHSFGYKYFSVLY